MGKKTKITKVWKQSAIKWIEENGVCPTPKHPTLKGACTVTDFCRENGISDTHWYRVTTSDKAFLDEIEKADDIFKGKQVKDCINNLRKLANGFQSEKTKLTETGVMRNGRMSTTTAVRYTEKVNILPNVAANIFLLTNLDPDNWKNKQSNDFTGDISLERPVIFFGDDDSEIPSGIDKTSDDK